MASRRHAIIESLSLDSGWKPIQLVGSCYTCVFIAAGTCLPSRSLAMAVSSVSKLLAFRLQVNILSDILVVLVWFKDWFLFDVFLVD
jgi:hypothetical protein